MGYYGKTVEKTGPLSSAVPEGMACLCCLHAFRLGAVRHAPADQHIGRARSQYHAAGLKTRQDKGEMR